MRSGHPPDARAIALPAAKGGLWTWLWRTYVGWSFRRSFAALHLRGGDACAPLPDRPTVFVANHSSWWDGFVAHLVMESHLCYDGCLPMEESNLRRFPSMTRLGAFGLDRENPRQALAALNWAAWWITAAPSRGLWIFPQGALRPQDERPLRLEGGAARVAEATGARLVPVACRYEFRDRERPEVFVSLGEGLVPSGDRRETARVLAAALTAEVDGLARDVAADAFDRGQPIFEGARGVDATWERIKGALRPRGQPRTSPPRSPTL